jgi:hypothetical protein
MEQQQQQQPENEQRAGDAGQVEQAQDNKPYNAELLEQLMGMIGAAKGQQKVLSHFDIHIYGLTGEQFMTVNDRVKQFFDGLREEGVLPEKAELSVTASAQDADPAIDDMDRIHRELHSLEDAAESGSLDSGEYLKGLQRINKLVTRWLVSSKLAAAMAGKHDIHTPEGMEAAQQEAKDILDGQATTHFSPEQQAADH